MTQIPTLLFVVGIVGLFVLDRDPKARTSHALWLPVLWLLLAGSRPVSVWLGGRSSLSLEQQYADGNPLDRSIYFGLLATGVIVLVGRRTSVLKLLRANGPLLLFVLYCLVSTSWSDYPDVAFRRWIKSLGDYVMILILLTDRDRLCAVKQVLARVGFVLLPLSVLFIKYYPNLGRAYASRWEGTQYFVGVADNKNMLGLTCLVFGLAASWRVLQEFRGLPRSGTPMVHGVVPSPIGWFSRRARTLVVHSTLLLMALWLFRMANSVTSVACFVLASVLMAATTFLKVTRRGWVVHLLTAGALLVCFGPLFLNIGGGFLENMGRNSTLTGRTEIWGQLIKVPINPIVGTGFESFWLGKRLDKFWAIPNMGGINEAHNGFFELYLNLGWIGVTLLVVVMLTGYGNIVRQFNREPELARIRLAYVFVAAAYSSTEAAFRMMSPVWMFFLFAVIMVQSIPARRQSSTAPDSENRNRADRSVSAETSPAWSNA